MSVSNINESILSLNRLYSEFHDKCREVFKNFQISHIPSKNIIRNIMIEIDRLNEKYEPEDVFANILNQEDAILTNIRGYTINCLLNNGINFIFKNGKMCIAHPKYNNLFDDEFVDYIYNKMLDISCLSFINNKEKASCGCTSTYKTKQRKLDEIKEKASCGYTSKYK